jgi:uncharacterized sulfatase
LYVKNFKPERWPAGDPAPTPDAKGIVGYEDIDDSPTKRQMMERADRWPELFQAGFGKKPEEELYDMRKDPGCLVDLSGQSAYGAIKRKLRKELENTLRQQQDPRITGSGDIFETYPRFGKMRPFPGFNIQGKYHTDYLSPQKNKE